MADHCQLRASQQTKTCFVPVKSSSRGKFVNTGNYQDLNKLLFPATISLRESPLVTFINLCNWHQEGALWNNDNGRHHRIHPHARDHLLNRRGRDAGTFFFSTGSDLLGGAGYVLSMHPLRLGSAKQHLKDAGCSLLLCFLHFCSFRRRKVPLLSSPPADDPRIPARSI